MPPCTIRLTVDSSTVRSGEAISGVVEIQAEESFDCRALSVGLRWRAKADWGQADEGLAPGEQKLFEGPLEAGLSARYPFTLTVPPTLWTYIGKNFAIKWFVDAKADIPSSRDVHAEEPLEIIPPESVPEAELNADGFGISKVPGAVPEGTPETERWGRTVGTGCLTFFGLAFFCMGLFPLLLTLFTFAQAPLASLISAASSLVFVVVGATLMLLGLRDRLARSRVGDVTVDISPRLVRPGESVRCAVSFQPRGDMEIPGISATLKFQETVYRHSRNGRRADRKTVWSQETQLEGRRLVRAGELVEVAGHLEIPRDATLSLTAPFNRAQWIVSAEIELKQWVDYHGESKIIVAPVARDELDRIESASVWS